MTNPIPGADSERAAFEAWVIAEVQRQNPIEPLTEKEKAFVLRRNVWDKSSYEAHDGAWQGWQARAAAKVGANVAADIPTWHNRRDADRAILRSHGEDDKGLPLTKYMQAEIAALRSAIAAGAPAETPKPVDAEAMEVRLNDIMKSFHEAWSANDRQRCEARLRHYLSDLRAVQPAPIAVLSDEQCDEIIARTWTINFSMKDHLRAAIRAAMLANSSSGEAG